MTSGRVAVRALTVLVVGALVFVGLAVVGYLNPQRQLGVGTDRLGPVSGEPVQDYLSRSRATLDGDAADHRWALASFGTHLTVGDAYAAARGVRISRMLFQVPIDRVQTPMIAVGVTGSERSVSGSSWRAAATLDPSVGQGGSVEQGGSVGQAGRPAEIAAVSADRLRSGCACVVGVVLRGSESDLTAVAAGGTVRAVEALPADAVDGKFAVSALLPQHIDTVGPLPDDADVPAR